MNQSKYQVFRGFKGTLQKNILGDCPRIGILFKIEKYFWNFDEFGQVSVDSERAFSDSLLGKP